MAGSMEMVMFLRDLRKNEKAKENMLRKKRLTSHFENLVSNWTLHGFRYIFDNQYRFRRFAWFILVSTAFGLLLQKLYESTQRYFNYPFGSTTTIQHGSYAVFPSVSICNVNDFRFSKMNNTKLHFAIQNNTEKGPFTPEQLAKYNLSSEEYQLTTKHANHRLETMLVSCSWAREPCGVEDFSQFYGSQGEKCYTFNSGQNRNSSYELPVYKTGADDGLKLTINIEQYDYYTDTEISGLRVLLHGPKQTPVKLQGYAIPPGQATWMELKRKKIKNLPFPYATKCGTRPLKYFHDYSQHACWLEQLTHYVVNACRCKDWFMPGDSEVCPLEVLNNCLWPKWEYFDKLKLEDCPLACEVEVYSATLSQAQLSTREIDKIGKTFNVTGTSLERRQFVRDNFLKVQLYYEDMSYELVELNPSYDIMGFFGDIGGQLGLFLGASVLTIAELLDCLCLTLFSWCFSRRPRSSNGLSST